ncbi:MAG: YihY/virulence factor BrkB family protein [Bacteroidia bacterium]|nr:YihY/virulence factor BrkB family protein [Bacteroidia bacterium]
MRLRSFFFRRYHRLLEWLERRHLPGFRGVNLYAVLNVFFKDVNNYDFTLRATAMAYSFFFALFPTLIFLFALTPYLPIADATGRLVDILRGTLPGDSFKLIEGTVMGVFKRRGVGVLSLAFAVVVFSATRGVRTMLQAFSKTDPAHFKRMKPWQLYFRAFYIFLALSLIGLLALATLISGEVALVYMLDHLPWLTGHYQLLFQAIEGLVSFAVITIGISFLYFVAPPVRERWRFFSPGSLLAALLMSAAQLGLRYYFVNFGSYNGVYGSLAAVMVLMLWFYYLSLVLLVGFELNAAIDKAYQKQQIKAEMAVAREGRARLTET